MTTSYGWVSKRDFLGFPESYTYVCFPSRRAWECPAHGRRQDIVEIPWQRDWDELETMSHSRPCLDCLDELLAQRRRVWRSAQGSPQAENSRSWPDE